MIFLAAAVIAKPGKPALGVQGAEVGYWGVLAGASGGRGFNKGPVAEPEPVHGKNNWELAKYEWREDGTGRFLYTRDNGAGSIERREVIRQQKGWAV